MNQKAQQNYLNTLNLIQPLTRIQCLILLLINLWICNSSILAIKERNQKLLFLLFPGAWEKVLQDFLPVTMENVNSQPFISQCLGSLIFYKDLPSFFLYYDTSLRSTKGPIQWPKLELWSHQEAWSLLPTTSSGTMLDLVLD